MNEIVCACVTGSVGPKQGAAVLLQLGGDDALDLGLRDRRGGKIRGDALDLALHFVDRVRSDLDGDADEAVVR